MVLPEGEGSAWWELCSVRRGDVLEVAHQIQVPRTHAGRLGTASRSLPCGANPFCVNPNVHVSWLVKRQPGRRICTYVQPSCASRSIVHHLMRCASHVLKKIVFVPHR